MRRVAPLLLLLLAGCSPLAPSVSPERPGPTLAGAVRTGTHFAEVGDFPALQKIGYDFALVEFSPENPQDWQEGLQKAAQANLQLIVGLYPPPYKRNADGSWTIQPQGIAFLTKLKAHDQTVIGVFVYNEPYSSDPNPKGKQHGCGFYSAADLRQLRTTIQGVWSGARIYHDLGDPSVWAPGGAWWQENQKCIGDKYADQTGVADFVGLFDYPFDADRQYRKQESLAVLKREIDFVNKSMRPARPVVLGQAFASKAYGAAWPTKAQLRDWNCTLRHLGVEYLSWYPWRQEGGYDDYLVNHQDYWSLTVADACR